MPQEPQGRKAFLFPVQVAEILLKIPQDSCQRICQAALAYNLGRELPEMDVMESALFDSFRAQFDYFRERYQATCDRRREAANKRWKKQEICSAGAQDMPSTCSAGAQDMPSTCSAGAQDMPRICSAGAQDMPSTCSAGAQDMPRISIGYAEECIKDKDKDKDKDKEKEKEKRKNTPPNLGQPIAHTARARVDGISQGDACGAFFSPSGGEEDAYDPKAQPEAEYALGYQELLDAYPADHRRGIAKGYTLWHKLAYTPGVGHNRLMDSLAAWRLSEQWCKEDGKYIPDISSWLDKEYWRQCPKPSIYASGAGNTRTPSATTTQEDDKCHQEREAAIAQARAEQEAKERRETAMREAGYDPQLAGRLRHTEPESVYEAYKRQFDPDLDDESRKEFARLWEAFLAQKKVHEQEECIKLEALRKKQEVAAWRESVRRMPLVDLMGQAGYRRYMDLFKAGNLEAADALAESAREDYMAKNKPESAS